MVASSFESLILRSANRLLACAAKNGGAHSRIRFHFPLAGVDLEEAETRS